jgi:hypothetical protein
LNRKLFILLLLFFQKGFTQQFFKRTQIQTTMGTIISSDSITPFLLRSNQYGLVPSKSGIGYVNLSLKKEYDSLYSTTNRKLKRLGYGYGLETHLNFGKANQMLLPIAHIKLRYGAFEIYSGRRREIQGLVDTNSTMGSYIWSGNALPMPKIEISIPNYTAIMKNGLIAIKGNFAHGWFGKGDSVQNVWLHQKSFYARLGKPAWKVHLYGGFNHQVQWGGYPTYPFYEKTTGRYINRFNTDISTYLKILSGVSLNKDGNGNSMNSSVNEATNRVGNHLGTIDIGFEFRVKEITIKFNRQNIYEDGSLFYLNNISDGLTSLSFLKNTGHIRGFCLEYLKTSNQGGPIFSDIPQLRGKDNYFNNTIYKDNWTYKKMTIGNALMTRSGDIKDSKSQNPNYILNNLVEAFSININSYLFKNMYSKMHLIKYNNFGNFQKPISQKQYSIIQQIRLEEKNNTIKFELSCDYGNFWPKNIGLKIDYKRILRF